MADYKLELVHDVDHPPVVQKERQWDACRHLYTTVDPVLRRLTCNSCDETLDPIEFLIELAKSSRQRDYRLAEWQRYQAAEKAHREREQARRKRQAEAK